MLMTRQAAPRGNVIAVAAVHIVIYKVKENILYIEMTLHSRASTT